MRIFAFRLILGLFLTSLAQAQPDPNYTLSLSSATGLPGESVAIRVFLDFPQGLGVSGIAFGVCASPGDASLVDNPCMGGCCPIDCVTNGIMEMGAALAATNNGQGSGCNPQSDCQRRSSFPCRPDRLQSAC